MEDAEIIELYWQRDETAITESEIKYGAYCRTIAHNIWTIVNKVDKKREKRS